MSLINCEVSVTLTWSANCVITTMEKRVVTDTIRDSSAINTTYTITDTKLYVTVVTLSAQDDNKLL